MNSSSLDVFCPKHSDSEAPISVITEILSENDSLKFKNISDEFGNLGFTKVKDLAGATLGKASSVKLSGDTLSLLYEAMEKYSERLDKLRNSAKSELQNGKFKETQEICKELLTHTPKDLGVMLLNATSFFNCEKYEECIDCLEEAKKINPDCCEVLSNFALVHMKKSENDVAIEYLFKVCNLRPFCADAWINYAELLCETNDLNSADLAYARVLGLKPELYKVRNDYGNLLLKLNKIKEAKQQFKIAHNSAKECPVTLKNLADVYYESAKFEKSILKYKQLLEINPDLAIAYYNLGICYVKVKEYKNASDAFMKAISLEPENVTYLKNLAVAHCLQDNMLFSAEIYKKCLKLKPEDIDLNLDLALIYLYNIKNYQEAAIYLEKCIELDPTRIDLYEKLFAAYKKSDDRLNAFAACMSMGDLHVENDDHENARNAFFCAVLMNPDDAYGHWKMGLALYNLGQSELALEKFRTAIEIIPNFPDFYYDVGTIYYDRGLIEQAKSYYITAITLSGEKGHHDAQLMLNDISMKQKSNLEDTIADIEKQ